MQYLDLHQWMPKDILLKADKMSMASSLELRVPLLDIEMQKLSQTIPTKYLINQNNTKDVSTSVKPSFAKRVGKP